MKKVKLPIKTELDLIIENLPKIMMANSKKCEKADRALLECYLELNEILKKVYESRNNTTKKSNK